MAKLVCPLCGVYTSFSPLLLKGKGVILDTLDTDRPVYQKLALYAVTDESYLKTSSQNVCYAILNCEACNHWFVAEKKPYKPEWSAVYPIPHKPIAKEIPEPIKSEFEEARLCFAVEAYRGCLLVCRTALIDLQRNQGVSKLAELKNKGAISEQLYRQADEVRLWANMIGHEEIPQAVTKEDCEQLLTYLELILDTVYIQTARLENLKSKRQNLKTNTGA